MRVHDDGLNARNRTDTGQQVYDIICELLHLIYYTTYIPKYVFKEVQLYLFRP
jgi:hypothetical protein